MLYFRDTKSILGGPLASPAGRTHFQKTHPKRISDHNIRYPMPKRVFAGLLDNTTRHLEITRMTTQHYPHDYLTLPHYPHDYSTLPAGLLRNHNKWEIMQMLTVLLFIGDSIQVLRKYIIKRVGRQPRHKGSRNMNERRADEEELLSWAPR